MGSCQSAYAWAGRSPASSGVLFHRVPQGLIEQVAHDPDLRVVVGRGDSVPVAQDVRVGGPDHRLAAEFPPPRPVTQMSDKVWTVVRFILYTYTPPNPPIRGKTGLRAPHEPDPIEPGDRCS